MAKSQVTLALDPSALEKIEAIAARSGLTSTQLLESVATLLADGELRAALSVTSRFTLQDYEFQINLESLIARHEGSPEELLKEVKKLKRETYSNA